MLKKPIAALMMLSLALLLGCGGDDEPQPEGGAPAAGAQAGNHGAAPAGGHAGAGGAVAPGSAASRSAARTGGSGQPIGANALGGLVKYVPAEATSALVLKPSETLGRKPVAGLGLERYFDQAVELAGVDPRDVERILIVGWADPSASVGQQPPHGGAVVRFKTPYQLDQLGGQAMPMESWQETTVAGQKAYLVGPATIVPINAQTMLIAPAPSAEQFLTTAASASTGLIDALVAEGEKHDFLFITVMTDAAKQSLPSNQEIPPQYQLYADMARNLDLVSVQADLSPVISLKLSATANSPEWAQKIQQAAGGLVFIAAAGMAGFKQQITDDPPPDMTPEQIETVFGILDKIVQGAQPKLTGSTVEMALIAPEELNPILEEYLPNLIAAAEGQLGTAGGTAEQQRSMNNLKQIGIAFHNHHDVHNSLPAQAAGGEAAGLSWRVQLLPFLEEQALYEQFKLDEPWDSEHNQALLEQMPDVFAASEDDGSEPGHTRYLAVSGEGTAFDGTQGKKLSAFRDGTSNSIIVVEAATDQAVPWTKPDDLDVANEEALQKLLSARDDAFLAAFADGRVTPVSGTIDLETLRNAFTIADGNPIDLD